MHFIVHFLILIKNIYYLLIFLQLLQTLNITEKVYPVRFDEISICNLRQINFVIKSKRLYNSICVYMKINVLKEILRTVVIYIYIFVIIPSIRIIIVLRPPHATPAFEYMWSVNCANGYCNKIIVCM